MTSVPARAGFRRTLDRIRAVGRLGLAPELAVPEMAILVGNALGMASWPAVFTVDADTAINRPQDFIVLLGAEQTVVELRALLKMGIWPGPRDTPSLQRIMTERENRRVFAATLWGEGCTDEGPWGDLWRARGIQQGLQQVFFTGSGLTGIAVMARATGAPFFTAAELAFAEAAAPLIAEALDAKPADDPYETTAAQTQLVLDGDRKSGPMSFGVAEMLREIGGGGPGAVEAVTARIEQLAAKLEEGPAYPVAGDPFVPARGVLPMRNVDLAENAFGRFSVNFSPLAGTNGHLLATVQRKTPRALLAVRGALASGASAREIELAAALARGQSLEGAASAMGVSASSTKTLLERIVARLDMPGRREAVARLIEIGRATSR